MLMLIRSLQIILHLPMFFILFPGNVLMVFKAIRPIVAFDILDIDFKSGPGGIEEIDSNELDLFA
jgi:hypothetical protein